MLRKFVLLAVMIAAAVGSVKADDPFIPEGEYGQLDAANNLGNTVFTKDNTLPTVVEGALYSTEVNMRYNDLYEWYVNVYGQQNQDIENLFAQAAQNINLADNAMIAANAKIEQGDTFVDMAESAYDLADYNSSYYWSDQAIASYYSAQTFAGASITLFGEATGLLDEIQVYFEE